MIGHPSPKQLAQAKRIAELRERRVRRVRLDAQHILKQCERKSDAAERELAESAVQEASAQALFFSNPADENSRVWLIASEEQKHSAGQKRDSAIEQREAAARDAEISRRQHEKACEKVTILDEEIAMSLRTVMHREEERALEDSEEQRA